MTGVIQTGGLGTGVAARAIYFGGKHNANYTSHMFYVDFSSTTICARFFTLLFFYLIVHKRLRLEWSP